MAILGGSCCSSGNNSQDYWGPMIENIEQIFLKNSTKFPMYRRILTSWCRTPDSSVTHCPVSALVAARVGQVTHTPAKITSGLFLYLADLEPSQGMGHDRLSIQSIHMAVDK